MKALAFLLELKSIRDSKSLSDNEKHSRIMMMIAEKLDLAIENIKKSR